MFFFSEYALCIQWCFTAFRGHDTILKNVRERSLKVLKVRLSVMLLEKTQDLMGGQKGK